MTRAISPKICSILISALLLLASHYTPALAAPDEDLQTLEMFYEGKDLAVSATRSPKPLSQTAENVTVITAAEIEMMGAHTLADVLNNVPGIQVDDRGSVGTFSGVTLQGETSTHILVMEDGITLNFLGSSNSDIASIPLQNVERVEIVKGPGSSSWGSALGGVINIVTKSPPEDRRVGGALSFSAGERGTRDSRGEASGTVGNLGYYLYAGNLTSSGFSPHTAADMNNLHAKLRWALPHQASLLFTLGYTREANGEGGLGAGVAIDDRRRYLYATLSLNSPLGEKADLDLSLRRSQRSFDEAVALFPGEVLVSAPESLFGGSAKLTWRPPHQTVVVGGDFDHVKTDFHSTFDVPDFFSLTDQHFRSDKWGIFLNDTVSLGAVAVTPGVRYDRAHPVGDFISPSLGAAWSLNEQTVLRAYGAKGYGYPVITPGSIQVKVGTLQLGAETSQVPYLWLKATLFWNRLSDVNVNDVLTRERKQGVEVEARTVPLFNTSLSAGYTYVDARNMDSGEPLLNVPSQIVKMGLHYDDKRVLRGTLLGRYVWWNGSPDHATKDKAIIWDLNLAGKVFTHRDYAAELFFSAHNLFNGAQFNDDSGFENARRWLEGGIRFGF